MKTASEEGKELKIKTFHERYREERVEQPMETHLHPYPQPRWSGAFSVEMQVTSKVYRKIYR